METRFLVIFAFFFVIGCCDNKKKTTSQVEQVAITVTAGEIPIYCCTTVEEKEDWYYVTNMYIINLPSNYRLEHQGDHIKEGKSTSYIGIHKDDYGRYSNRLATKKYPTKGYREFVVTNDENKVRVKLPYWESNWE